MKHPHDSLKRITQLLMAMIIFLCLGCLDSFTGDGDDNNSGIPDSTVHTVIVFPTVAVDLTGATLTMYGTKEDWRESKNALGVGGIIDTEFDTYFDLTGANWDLVPIDTAGAAHVYFQLNAASGELLCIDYEQTWGNVETDHHLVYHRNDGTECMHSMLTETAVFGNIRIETTVDEDTLWSECMSDDKVALHKDWAVTYDPGEILCSDEVIFSDENVDRSQYRILGNSMELSYIYRVPGLDYDNQLSLSFNEFILNEQGTEITFVDGYTEQTSFHFELTGGSVGVPSVSSAAQSSVSETMSSSATVVSSSEVISSSSEAVARLTGPLGASLTAPTVNGVTIRLNSIDSTLYNPMVPEQEYFYTVDSMLTYGSKSGLVFAFRLKDAFDDFMHKNSLLWLQIPTSAVTGDVMTDSLSGPGSYIPVSDNETAITWNAPGGQRLGPVELCSLHIENPYVAGSTTPFTGSIECPIEAWASGFDPIWLAARFYVIPKEIEQ
ncbi:MAG: hypothetical protein OCC49_10140 [Fibrobacterales bacterium]